VILSALPHGAGLIAGGPTSSPRHPAYFVVPVRIKRSNAADITMYADWVAEKRDKTTDRKPALLALAALTLCVLNFAWSAYRGFDFTDDGYYLMWAWPRVPYRYFISAAGYLWHPLYQLTGGNVAWFRMAGAAVLALCASGFGWAFMHSVHRNSIPVYTQVAFFVAILSGAFQEFDIWASAPSYNEMTLCGLLVLFTGMILASFASEISPSVYWRYRQIGYSGLAGAALAIVALAKPTSGVVATMILIAWLALIRPKWVVACLLAGTAAALVVVAVVLIGIAGSITAAIHGVMVAVQADAAVATGHGGGALLRAIAVPKGQGAAVKYVVFTLLFVGIFTASYWTMRRVSSGSRRSAQLGVMSAATLIVAIDVALTLGRHVLGMEPLQGLMFAMPIVCLGSCTALTTTSDWTDKRVTRACALLFLVPVAYGFGTNAQLYLKFSMAAIFWLAPTALIALNRVRPGVITPVGALAMLCIACTVGLRFGVCVDPYRLGEPLWKQDRRVTVGPDAAQILVDATAERYIRGLRDGAYTHDFKPHTPVIDVAGDGAGDIFVLGGDALVMPIGVYRGHISPEFPRIVLALAPRADLDRAWILTRDDTANNDGRRVLRSLSLAFPEGYETVARAQIGGRDSGQTLWKPKSATAR